MITAKQAFEATKIRGQKAKEDKFSLVEEKIGEAIVKEQYSVSFSMVTLKPFVGAVIEKLHEGGFKVEQSATSLNVSWDLNPKPVKEVPATVAAKTSVLEDEEPEIESGSIVDDDDYYDDLDDSL